jgi:hypothetical protein
MAKFMPLEHTNWSVGLNPVDPSGWVDPGGVETNHKNLGLWLGLF